MKERITEPVVSPLPVFDFEKALLAKEETGKGKYKDIPNVRAAGNLWLYNNPTERWPAVLRKLTVLRHIEESSSGPDNSLPTIGWEVEIPRKPFKTSRAGIYALFFDFIGLPRNRNHTSIVPGEPLPSSWGQPTFPFFWEFSTAPAFNAAVVNRTLSELIKGGFIPYLIGPSTAEDRYNLLDNKLVSMHVNLGIPLWLQQMPREADLGEQEDIVLLASSFEFAYTSPERFIHRSRSSMVQSVSAEQTIKNNSDKPLRLELKAFEVGSSNTYRDKYRLDPNMIVAKSVAAEKVRDGDAQRDLRLVLTEAAHQVRLLT